MATIILLQKSDLTEDKVNFVQTIPDVQINPHINRVLKFQLKAQLQAPLWKAIMLLNGLDDTTLTADQTTLYNYYKDHIKDYCIVQAWYNHLDIGDVHFTPAGKRVFNESQSSSIEDSVFAGLVRNATSYLKDATNSMLEQLEADKWTIANIEYKRDCEQAKAVAESSIGFSVIRPPRKRGERVDVCCNTSSNSDSSSVEPIYVLQIDPQ